MTATAAETFEHLVRHQSAPALVAFLVQLPKADLLPVRLKTKQLYRALNDWQSEDAKQLRPREGHLLLAGLATYTKQEALGRSFGIPWNFNYDNDKDQRGHKDLFMQVLRHSRPAWLTAWLERIARSDSWRAMPYWQLRELAEEGLVAYTPALFAQALAAWLSNYNRQQGSHGREYDVHILRKLQADTTLRERDLPLLFDFDTPVDSAAIYRGKAAADITWLTLLPQLVASGHLDRGDLLTRSLLALRRDFRRPLLTWFKNLFLSFKPTTAERLARQTELVELLAHPLPLVVNFALDQLKDLWLAPELDPALLLQYAEGLLARQDLKTGLRTLLGGCEKLLKRQPALAPTVARLAAAALANADGAVQERAAKLLVGILAAKKPLLTPEETLETTASIGLYADLLAAAARSVLTPFLSKDPAVANPAGTGGKSASYAPIVDFQPDISPATAIAPVADWHELLFLTGPALLTDDPAALERWLDGLLRLRPHFPVDFARQLLPYLYQALPWELKGQPEAEALRQVRAYKFDKDRNDQRTLTLALLLGLLTDFAVAKVPEVTFTSGAYSSPDPLLRAERQRRVFVETQLRTASTPLPLLSTPTHAPFWVAPGVLVDKLLAYQAASQQPDAADLALALARTACHAAADATAARQRLPELQHTGLRQLLAWFLAPAGTTAPLPDLAAGQSVGGVLAGMLRRFWSDSATAVVPASLAGALPWLWVVAARTRCPEATFAELRPLADYPGVAAPWQPGWHFEPASETYKQPWNKQQPEVTHTWQELRVPTEHQGQPAPSPLLLYSLHARLPQKDNHYLWSLGADWQFLLSLLPHDPAPLHWHLLRTACRTGDGYSEERDLLQKLLHSLLGAGPRFPEVTSALLAVGLVYNAPGCRALALEVLLSATTTGRLVPADLGTALGKLLTAEFAPVQRLVENLAQARAIAPATDDALRQTLDVLLPALPAEPPRNTRKLLEAYSDLLGRVPQPVPAAVQARLREWSAAPSLRKAAAGLLS